MLVRCTGAGAGVPGRGARRGRAGLGGLLAMLVVLGFPLTGCDPPAITRSSTPEATAPGPAAGAGDKVDPTGAFGGAATKLRLISQDSCQTDPPERVYPFCGRYLAELRSAAGTLANGATGPDADAIRAGASSLLEAASGYDRDGCGGGPYATGAEGAPACVADLGRIRGALTALRARTDQVPTR